MSTHPQPQLHLTTYPSQAFDWELPDFRYYVHSSNLPVRTPTTENMHFYPACVREHSSLQCIPFPWHANQVTALSASTHINQQMQYNSTSWRATDMPEFPEPLPIFSLPTRVEIHGSHVTSTSHRACDPGPDDTYWGSHTGFDFSRAPQPHPSDRPFLLHPVELGIRNTWNGPPHEPITYRSLSHATHFHPSSTLNDQNVTDSPHLPSHQSSNPPFPHWSPLSTSTVYPEPDPRFRFVPPQDSIGSSRHRRGARAIECGSLWIDEEELLQGLTEPNGRLIVHQCLWEEDRSPCHLWINSDKSCIHTHIQKWHRGQPGGDKLETNCHWSACGQRMLKESIARHILSIHLGERWVCRGCGKENARKDAYGRHITTSDFEGCKTADASITYSAEARMIDARAALDSGGRLRYADA